MYKACNGTEFNVNHLEQMNVYQWCFAVVSAEGGEIMNASTDNTPKIEILPSSDFSKLICVGS